MGATVLVTVSVLLKKCTLGLAHFHLLVIVQDGTINRHLQTFLLLNITVSS